MRISDWSSDVCSSDLQEEAKKSTARRTALAEKIFLGTVTDCAAGQAFEIGVDRAVQAGKLTARKDQRANEAAVGGGDHHLQRVAAEIPVEDRKSTRLNSSH